MPSFDLSTKQGLSELNEYLATRSYIEGYQPSQADVAALNTAPRVIDSDTYPHVYRWAEHIGSFSSEARAAFPGKAPAAPAAPAAAAPAKAEEKVEEEAADDDDFGFDDEDDAEAEALLAKKKAEAEAAKKAKAKEKPAAKSSIIFDIKPMEAETDLDKLEADVRAIVMEGVSWGGSKRVPVAYGVFKLQVNCIVIDDLVAVDDLEDKISSIEDVQSVDIFAFNKV